MENKNTGLKVFVIVLSVLVVALSGYIVYDKVLNNKDVDNNYNDLRDNSNNESSITKDEIIELFEFVYNYYEKPVLYCGESKSVIDINDEMHGYYESSEFNTYDEMINKLKKYMSNEVIKNKQGFAATNKNFYKENNGKLYCQDSYKGYMYGHGNIDIEITSQNENKIYCIATMELIDMSNNKTYDKVDKTLEKNNNNWIITSYEKQNTELR